MSNAAITSRTEHWGFRAPRGLKERVTRLAAQEGITSTQAICEGLVLWMNTLAIEADKPPALFDE